MTKKDYIIIASVFKINKRTNSEGGEDLILESFAREMADALIIDNPRFDRNRFLEACGIDK